MTMKEPGPGADGRPDRLQTRGWSRYVSATLIDGKRGLHNNR